MDKIRALVIEELNELDNIIFNSFNSNNIILEDLRKFLIGKSKRVRSVLSILYLKANGIDISDKIYDLLTAGELIHNASLLHDDVIDNSEYRRENETLYKKYGSKMSVLSGDYLLSLAVKYLINLNNKDILNEFINVTQKMSSAEVKQFLNRNKDISLDDYLEIIEGKTASLFSAIIKCSAILAGLDKSFAENLGKIFGIIFQINNDLKPESVKNDNLNGVRTAKDILGIEKTLALKDNYKEEMRKLIKYLPNNNYLCGLEDLINLL